MSFIRTYFLAQFYHFRYNRYIMSKRQTLMVLGIWVIILPFLGFPGTWKSILFCATGLVIATIAYALRPETRVSPASNITYAEHKNEPAPVSENTSPSDRPLVG